MTDISRQAAALNLSFNNPALLEEALMHRSYLNEDKDAEALA